MRLTDISVKALAAPEEGAKVYYDDSLKGFGVRVSQAGTKAFVLATGKSRDRVTLGRYPIVSLAEARQAAKNILAERQLGRHQAPKTTLGAALDLYTEKHLEGLAPNTQREQKRLFKRHLDKLRTKKLAELTTHDLTRITDKLAPSEAEHLHRASKAFFRWCVRRRLLQHSPLEGLEAPSRWTPRDRVLNDEELRDVWHAADKLGGMFGTIVKLLILTGQRRGEISALEANWIGQQSVTLPATICKNRLVHTFPIGKLTQAIIQPCTFNGWSKSKARLDAAIAEDRKKRHAEPMAAYTLHDLRRTLATNWQRLGIKTEVIEAYLNHVSGTKAGIIGVYQRHRWEAEMVEAVTAYENWFTKTIIPR